MLLFVAFLAIGVVWWRIQQTREELELTKSNLRAEFDRGAELAREVQRLSAAVSKLAARPAKPIAPDPFTAEPQTARPIAPGASPAAADEWPPKPDPVVVTVPAPPSASVPAPPPLAVANPLAASAPPSVQATPPPLPATVPTSAPPKLTEPSAIPVPQSFLPERKRIELDQALARISAKKGGWEELIGGDVLNKVGALLVVIGIALFLGYSFTNMGPGGRAFTGAGIGAAMLAAGIAVERKPRYRLFSRGLIAAGWASLYFTSYAMYAIDATRVIASPVAGGLLMTAVAASMVAHSIRYRVQSLTGLAYACAFAALALSGSYGFMPFALVPVALSMLYLAYRFEWHGVALFGAAATYATFFSGGDPGTSLFQVESILLLYWLIFESFDLLRVLQRKPAGPIHFALFGLNAFAGLGASAACWYQMAPESMWEFCAIGAALYLGSTWIRCLISRESLYEYTLAVSALLGALAIVAHVEGLWAGLGLMLEAEALFLAGLYLHARFARVLSLAGFTACLWQMAQHSGFATVAGVEVHNWAPLLAVLAGVFYANRRMAPDAQYFSYAASVFGAVILGAELPWRFAAAGWFAFGAVLFELGLRKRLPEFRIQAYGCAALGAAGSAFAYLDPLHVRHLWTYTSASALAIATAIRATRWLTELPDAERRFLRIAGALGTVLGLSVLIVRSAPEAYWGIVLLASSVALYELALRRLPSELGVPSLAMSGAGLVTLAWTHAFGLAKHPETAVAVSVGGAMAIGYWLVARLVRETDPSRSVLRDTSLVAASVLAAVNLWMYLPDAFVPAAIGALAVLTGEAGLALSASGLPGALFTLVGRVMGATAFLAIPLLGLAPGVERVWNGGALCTVQWFTWFRNRRHDSAVVHGWIATLAVVVLVVLDAPANAVAGLALFAAALAVAGRIVSNQLRWQASAVAMLCAWLVVLQPVGLWQAALAAAAFAAALLLDRAETGSVSLRPHYGLGSSLIAAITLFREVSGGVLTVSWSLEAIALLAAGFLLGERILRLGGLGLLMACVAKAFFYDLRNLDTVYRILSFIGLGVILIAVSWMYTRFRDQVRKYL